MVNLFRVAIAADRGNLDALTASGIADHHPPKDILRGCCRFTGIGATNQQ